MSGDCQNGSEKVLKGTIWYKSYLNLGVWRVIFLKVSKYYYLDLKRKQGQGAEGEEKAIILSPVFYAQVTITYLNLLYCFISRKVLLFNQKPYFHEIVTNRNRLFSFRLLRIVEF
jgi:hypothetical protein